MANCTPRALSPHDARSWKGSTELVICAFWAPRVIGIGKRGWSPFPPPPPSVHRTINLCPPMMAVLVFTRSPDSAMGLCVLLRRCFYFIRVQEIPPPSLDRRVDPAQKHREFVRFFKDRRANPRHTQERPFVLCLFFSRSNFDTGQKKSWYNPTD